MQHTRCKSLQYKAMFRTFVGAYLAPTGEVLAQILIVTMSMFVRFGILLKPMKLSEE